MNVEPEVLGIFILCMFLIGGFVAQIMSAWRSTRRVPPIDQELYRDFATKAELRLVENKIEIMTRSTNEALMNLTKEISGLSGELRSHLRGKG